MRHVLGMWAVVLMVAGTVQAAHFVPFHEMTYSNSDAMTKTSTAEPNNLGDRQDHWHPNDNSTVSSTYIEAAPGEAMQADSDSSIQFMIDTAGAGASNNQVHLTADASAEVEMTTDDGIDAYAWAGSSTVAIGSATGNFYTIEADTGESVGDVVSVTFTYSAVIATDSIGGSSYSGIVDGGWAGDDMLVTLNCADLDDPQPGEIVHRVARKDSDGTYTDEYTFEAHVGDVIGLHVGVIATAYTGTNPGWSEGSVSADIQLTVSDAVFDPSQADFDRSGKVDLADFAKFASAWLWEKPVNDICANAETAHLNTHYTGTTEGMTDASVWYVFTPVQSDFYTLSICDGGWEYFMEVYDACEGNYLSATDEDCRLVVWMEAGNDYFISIYGYQPTENYNLSITQGAETPYNDDCGNAEPFYDYAEGITLGATGDDQSSCGQDDTHDVWYVFTPEVSGYYNVALYNRSMYFPFGGTVTVYDGDSCEFLPEELDCGEVSGDSVELYGVWMEEGQSCLIRVGSDGPDAGFFGLEVYEEEIPM